VNHSRWSVVGRALVIAVVAVVITGASGGEAEAFTLNAAGYICVDNEETTGFPPDLIWDDISATGAIQNAGNNANIGSFVVGLPWIFTFFGVAYNIIGMNSNGYLQMGGLVNNVDFNIPVPGAGVPNQACYGFWDDLVPNLNPNNVRSQILGVQPDRRLVISFNGIPLASGQGTVTFQFALYEAAGGNAIRIQYLTMTGAQATGTLATVGIENVGGTLGLSYLQDGFPATNDLYSGLTIGFYPVGSTPPWPVEPPPPPVQAPGASFNGPSIDEHEDYDSTLKEFRAENCSADSASSGAWLLMIGALALSVGMLGRSR
jgi:hypothetical protein